MRFLPTDIPVQLSRRRRRSLIVGLAFTQMTAWGTTFYLPSVIGPAMAAEIGIAPEVQFGGVTLMLLVAAVFSPRVGKLIDAHGARATMATGSLLLAIGLVGIAASQGRWSYLAAWLSIGAAVPLAMSSAAFAAVAQAYPGEGRRPITMLMLMSGLSSGVYWPLTGWLAAGYGWRLTLLLFAALHVCVCLPVHIGVVRRPGGFVTAGAAIPAGGREPLTGASRQSAYWLIVVGAGVSGLASWGVPLQFIPLFQEAGMSESVAIFIAALQAPAALLARLFDLVFARRIPAATLVAQAGLAAPLVFVGIWFALRPPLTGLDVAMVTFWTVVYGVCTALITAARSTLPLELFGSAGYATLLGRMSLWLNIVFALSRLLFAALRHHGGMNAVVGLALLLSIAAALAFRRLSLLAGS